MDTRFFGFKLSTAVSKDSPLEVSTSRATITFIPSEEGHLSGAEVVVHNRRNDEETQQTARKELIKAILAKLSSTVRIKGGPSGAHEISTTEEEELVTKEGSITKSANFTVVRQHSEEDDDLLQIDLDSDSEAIYAYCIALTKNDPFDRFGDLFNVVEFLAGSGGRKNLSNSVNSKWWIPERIVRGYEEKGLSREEAIEEIIGDIVDWRGKCRHLKPNYHFSSTKKEDIEFIESRMYVMEAISRLSLEKNPETCEKKR
jgi:hypothetical protein